MPVLKPGKHWLALGWFFTFLMVVLSLIPFPSGWSGSHAETHLAGYAFLMWWFSQVCSGKGNLKYGFGFVALGIAVELFQDWVPYRDFEFLDIFSNTGGVLIGGALARVLRVS